MTKFKRDDGFVLTTAMIVLFIMLLLGLAVMATVNSQVNETGHEKAGEASFNLADSVLQAEAYQLQASWPTGAQPTCNQSSPQTVGCEGVALTNSLSSSYAGPTYAGATWTAQVLDDTGGKDYYSDSLAANPATPSYDANGDGRVWVRVQALVGGQKRVLVEQMVRTDSVVTVPDNTVTAGAVYTENLGNKVIIEAHDQSSGLTGNVEVRCGSGTTQPVQGQGNCLGWSSAKGQLDPSTAYGAGYVDPNGGYQTLSDSKIAALVQTAQAAGTYYATGTCPPAGTAGVVVVQNADCSYQGNDTWNTAASPGALIFLQGSVAFNGNETFYGVLYMANQAGTIPPCSGSTLSAPPLVDVHGNATVYGAVFVDRCGVVAVGESHTNISFSTNALAGLYAAQAAMPAQNTFRIVPNS
jgi:type II secretory pathway pseudopilin PulG